MSSSVVHIEKPEVDIVQITLNRPQSLNALNVDLLTSLVNALQAHASARIIILQGAGDRSFCAGEDLKQTLAPKTGSAGELREAFKQLQDLTRLTSFSNAIIIAAVQGFAIGGGAEIALAADFVIGGPAAKFRFPEVPIGHAATGGITLRLTQMVGLLKAKELLLTGKWIEAPEALKIGLLSEIHDDPKARALELAKELAKLPAVSLAASKASLERSVFPNMETSLTDEINVASYCFSQSAAAKAFTDFAARKSPATVQGGPVSSQSIDDAACPVIRDINAALKYAAKTFANSPFLRFSGHDLTFAEFDAQVAKVAGGLRDRGIGPGDRVMVMMHNSVEMVLSWMATNRLGAVWVPINTELRSVTLTHAIQVAKPQLIIVDALFWPLVQSTNTFEKHLVVINGNDDADLYTFSALLASSPVYESSPVAPSTTSAFLYTSGTTGKSKPCVLSHEYFILQARALIASCRLVETDVLFCPFPLFHADATALTVIPAILLGAVAALSVRFSASRFWDEIRVAKATVYDFMGATLALTYKQPSSGKDREHGVRLAWGVPMPHFADDYEERFGHKLVTLYGSVEASLPIFHDCSQKLAKGSCGRLLPGHQLRIVDELDEDVPLGMVGNLLLRSDKPNSFFQGYFDDFESTSAAFRGLWLHTGDLAKVDADGNVYFMGRTKDIIRRRGENVNASEVEEEFLQHPDVLMAAAFGIPSQLGAGTEEDVKVVVQMRKGSCVSEQALWSWAAQRMARFQVPSVIQFVDEIKRTPTGKTKKYGLSLEGGQRFEARTTKLDG
ncbi:hypothetical protein NQ176_g950 [Zarea fungicola]|uniref:Uncharacterized protein n=1 Tax=Zarea fungicola TaxID=93591 RepID=A0ACC1NWB6_9HYPO|nr:hypothetical protein NQ176_g950 [Lecanicillium fungicola]